MELLSCISALNPSDSFASFDAQKVRRLAEFYPNDIKGNNVLRIEMQLDNFIDDIRQDVSFKGQIILLISQLSLLKQRGIKYMTWFTYF